EGGQLVQTDRRVQALAVPAEQAADREAVPKAVQRRRGNPVGDGQVEGCDEAVEDRGGGAGSDAAAPVEAEQRSVGPGRAGGRAALGVLLDQLGDARPVRDEAALAELAAGDHEQATAGVDVAEAKPARLSGA